MFKVSICMHTLINSILEYNLNLGAFESNFRPREAKYLQYTPTYFLAYFCSGLGFRVYGNAYTLALSVCFLFTCYMLKYYAIARFSLV